MSRNNWTVINSIEGTIKDNVSHLMQLYMHVMDPCPLSGHWEDVVNALFPQEILDVIRNAEQYCVAMSVPYYSSTANVELKTAYGFDIHLEIPKTRLVPKGEFMIQGVQLLRKVAEWGERYRVAEAEAMRIKNIVGWFTEKHVPLSYVKHQWPAIESIWPADRRDMFKDDKKRIRSIPGIQQIAVDMRETAPLIAKFRLLPDAVLKLNHSETVSIVFNSFPSISYRPIIGDDVATPVP